VLSFPAFPRSPTPSIPEVCPRTPRSRAASNPAMQQRRTPIPTRVGGNTADFAGRMDFSQSAPKTPRPRRCGDGATSRRADARSAVGKSTRWRF
jgi:hypothetical protein